MKITSTAIVLIALSTSIMAHADTVKDLNGLDPEKYYGIGDVQVTEDKAAEVISQELNQAMPALAPSPLDLGSIVGSISLPVTIVNLGLKLWSFIQANQPVVNISTQSANALPQGITSWQQLSGWNTPMTRVFHATYKNLYGMTVIDFEYQVIYTSGGTVKGQGRYLTNVSVLPTTVTVAWGYKLNAEVSIPDVINVGTDQDPIAGAQIDVKWHVGTVFKSDDRAESYFVRGDGDLVQIAGLPTSVDRKTLN